MSRRAVSRLWSGLQRVGRRVSARGLILLYHRVAEAPVDPWNLCVTPSHFAQHLQILARWATVVPLTALPETLARARPGQTIVALTFDDGYADNLEHAKPLLERYGLPATMFLTTGYVGCERGYWWDELADLMLGPHPLPARLDIAGQGARWRVENVAASSEGRMDLLLRLWYDLRPLEPAYRMQLLEALALWAGRWPPSAGRGRPLRADEVRSLVDGGLIEIGAHTVNHPPLPMLPDVAKREELVASRKACEQLVGRPVTTFSYPFGELCEQTVRQVHEAGFAFACTTSPRVMGRDCGDPLLLPRLTVGDWSGMTFAANARIVV